MPQPTKASRPQVLYHLIYLSCHFQGLKDLVPKIPLFINAINCILFPSIRPPSATPHTCLTSMSSAISLSICVADPYPTVYINNPPQYLQLHQYWCQLKTYKPIHLHVHPSNLYVSQATCKGMSGWSMTLH